MLNTIHLLPATLTMQLSKHWHQSISICSFYTRQEKLYHFCVSLVDSQTGINIQTLHEYIVIYQKFWNLQIHHHDKSEPEHTASVLEDNKRERNCMSSRSKLTMRSETTAVPSNAASRATKCGLGSKDTNIKYLKLLTLRTPQQSACAIVSEKQSRCTVQVICW